MRLVKLSLLSAATISTAGLMLLVAEAVGLLVLPAVVLAITVVAPAVPLAALGVLVVRRIDRLRIHAVKLERLIARAEAKGTRVEAGLDGLRRELVEAKAYSIAALEDVASLSESSSRVVAELEVASNVLHVLEPKVEVLQELVTTVAKDGDARSAQVAEALRALKDGDARSAQVAEALRALSERPDAEGLKEAIDEAQHSIAGLLSSEHRRLSTLVRLVDGVRHGLPLPPMEAWSISPDVGEFLLEAIALHGSDRILEIGSGTSTVLLAEALRARGRGHVVAVEHLAPFAQRTRNQLKARGLEAWADVVEAPLVTTHIAGEPVLWYDQVGIPSGPFDLLFVDGPPSNLGPLARYPALPLLAGRLSSKALVVLDDSDRPDEVDVVGRWVAETPGLLLERIPTERGLAVLTFRNC